MLRRAKGLISLTEPLACQRERGTGEPSRDKVHALEIGGPLLEHP